MIFSHPLTLAGRYLTYVVMIVLLGMMIVEYFTRKEWWRADKARFRAFLTLVAITVLGVSWITVDLLGDISVLLPLHVYWVLLGLTTAALAYISLLAWRGALRLPVFTVLTAVVLGTFALGLERSGYPNDTAWPRIVDFVVSTTGVIFYYLMIIKILMLNGPQLADSGRPRTTKTTRSSKPLRYFLIIGVFAFSALTVYFGARAFTKTPTARDDVTAPQSVTVRLKWIPQAQFAGLYIAEQKGHYKDEGIEPKILPFDYEHQPIDDVINGFGTFGVAGADEVLAARAEGKPVVALAAIYQESPVAITVPASSNISSIADLKGKRIGLWDPLDDKVIGGDELMGYVLFEKAGLDFHKDADLVFVGFDGVDKLKAGEVDAIMTYITDEPIRLERAGYRVVNITPQAYNIGFYGDVIFTSEQVIRDNPELVRRFVKASLRGWNYALLNPEEAVAATLKYEDIEHYGPMSHEHETSVFSSSAPLIKPGSNTKVGSMRKDIWQHMYDKLYQHESIGQHSSVNDRQRFSVKDVFTTKFLPQ